MRRFKVNVVSKEKIKKWEADKKPTIISKYASVPSETLKGQVYSVVRYRKGATVNAEGKVVRYSCTCPGFQFRLKECKHIAAFKKAERVK